MGGLCSCFDSTQSETNITPPPEERRRHQLEAAERRREANESRGIKNPERLKRQQMRNNQLNRREEEAARMGSSGAPSLRWQTG